MRRFGLFLGVFSVGLVLFMALTGQLSRFIQEDKDPFADEGWSADSHRENLVEIHDPDVKNGRSRFTLRGVIDSSEPLKINDTEFAKRATVRDAVLDMPLYPESDNDSAPTKFTLSARRVVYEPDSGTVSMKDGIEGASDNGARFETPSVEVKWTEMDGGDRRIRLEGNEPIDLSYPAIQLFGETGFVGIIDDEIGLGTLEIHPPVVVALQRGSGTGFLGFESEPGSASPSTEANGGQDPTEERIFVISEGPLRIERDAKSRRATARFTGRVSMFNAPATTPLHPRPDVPKEHFECERLELTLDGQMTLTEARAEGVERPVRAMFLVGPASHEYVLEGQTLVWAQQREAILTGDAGVSVRGPVGTLSARRARLQPAERLCYLEESIRAEIHAARLPGVDPSTDRRTKNVWTLDADFAVVEFAGRDDGGTEGSGFHLLRARSDTPGGLRVIEQIENGSRLIGTELEYSAGTETLEIRGPNEFRPKFTEGESRLAADVIRLRVANETLEFAGRVEGRVHGLVASNLIPEKIREQVDTGYGDIDCDGLVLQWRVDRLNGKDQRRLASVVGKRGADPLAFDLVSDRRLSLRGDQLRWSVDDGVVRVDGPGRQHLEVHDLDGRLALRFDAQTLSYDGAQSIAAASGLVEGETLRSFLVRRQLDEAEDRWVRFGCDAIEAKLRPIASGDAEKNSSAETTKADEGEKPKKSIVQHATATAEAPRWVTIEDGIVALRGRSLEWSPSDGTLVIGGDGAQQLRYGGEEGSHVFEAHEIRVEQLSADSASIKATLKEEVSGQLEQRFARDPNSREQRDPLLWDLHTEHLEVTLRVVAKVDDEKGRRLELDRLVAQDGVEIRNAAIVGPNGQERGPLTFTGRRCEWERSTQRLRVHSSSGDALQSLRLGPAERRDEIVAREIVLGRQGDSVWVYFQDVLRATFFVDEVTRRGRDEIPESFRMLCDNLLINLVGVEDRDGESSISVREAISWGSVNFKGGTTQVVAERAVFRAASSSVTFHGQPGQPPRVIDSGGRTPDLGDPIVVTRRRDGFSVDVKGRGTPVDLSTIQGVLRLLEKTERAPGN